MAIYSARCVEYVRPAFKAWLNDLQVVPLETFFAKLTIVFVLPMREEKIEGQIARE